MNHTPNYNLPQWELDDLIRMEDFNAAMASIETGIDGAKGEAKAGDAELQRQVNAANAKAEAAQSAASALPYVVGSYVGTEEAQEIVLGFRPSFVMVFSGMTTADLTYYSGRVALSGPTIHNKVYPTDNGFRVPTFDTNPRYPFVNYKGTTYNYIAFR